MSLKGIFERNKISTFTGLRSYCESRLSSVPPIIQSIEINSVTSHDFLKHAELRSELYSFRLIPGSMFDAIHPLEAFDEIDSCEFENLAFLDPVIGFRSCKKIYLRNCVFFGDLHINARDLQSYDVTIDTCLVLGEVKIYKGDSHGTGNVRVLLSNIGNLSVMRANLNSLGISASRVNHLAIGMLDCNSIYINRNILNSFETYQIQSNDIFYDHVQTSFANLGSKSKSGLSEDNFFKFEWSDNWEEQIVVEKSKAVMETFAFVAAAAPVLKMNPDIREDFLRHENLKNKKGIAYCISWAFAGFVSPMRIAIWAMGIYFTYGLLFLLPIVELDINGRFYDRLDGFWVSALLLSTNGYGSFEPGNLFTKCLLLSEAFLGLFLFGAFLVALQRKYIDRG